MIESILLQSFSSQDYFKKNYLRDAFTTTVLYCTHNTIDIFKLFACYNFFSNKNQNIFYTRRLNFLVPFQKILSRSIVSITGSIATSRRKESVLILIKTDLRPRMSLDAGVVQMMFILINEEHFISFYWNICFSSINKNCKKKNEKNRC